MLKNLLKDSVIYGAANAVQKLVPFFIIPVITGYLGQDALKIYDVSFVYAYLFSWLIILGQDAAASVLYFDEKKTRFDKRQVTAYAMVIQLAFLVLFFFLLIPFSDGWSSLLFPKDRVIGSWWTKALFIIPGHILLNYVLNILLWQKRQLAYILLCSIQTILSIASVIIAVVIFHGGIASLFYSLIGSMSLTALAGAVMIRKNIFVSFTPLNTELIKKLVLLGMPFALTSFFHQLLPSIDRYFLIQNGYSPGMAPYVLSAKLGSFFNFGVSAFVLAFTPYSMAKINEENAEKEISALFRVISVSAFVLVPVLLLFKDVLVDLFADSTYSLSASLLPYFFFGWVFDLFSYFTMLGVYRSQKSFLVLLLFASGIVIISLLNILLVPQFGLYGAAISFCFTKVFLFFLSLVWFRRYFNLQLHAPAFWLSLLIAVGYSYLIYILPLPVNIIVLLLLISAAFMYFRKQKLSF